MFEGMSTMMGGFLLILALALLIFFIFTLVHQAQNKKWLWFVLTILGLPLILWIYWIVWLISPKFRRKK